MSDILIESRCPTCGSKKVKDVTASEIIASKKECNNCKKFWFV
ncbi:MAG: hypothetical protein ACE5RA_06620 [Nitrosopumilus sp.]|jgi:hypothetical protein